ncbi:MAG: aryl-sulfate sulfotransferase, partial [Ignavibacteriaceae bacterium]
FNTGNYLMILNNDGSVLKYKEVDGFFGISFTVLPNGKLSYAQIIALSPGVPTGRFIVMDTTLAPVDTFQCGNGYITHPSDFLLLPNGHAILHATDPQPVDMSQYGGSPNAIVVGNIIQELDESKNVVFQWRSWDYLPISDSYINLTSDVVDLTHANALALDADGNILYSIRHTSSIISVNRQTGDVNWILGGKRNEFTFINEHTSNAPNYFSFQHDIRVLPNGNITLFDNGTQHSPQYSRGVEYELDEQNKTATLVWEFRHSPDLFAGANGSTQRLANGNTIIGWGSASLSGVPLFTEVHPDNSIALEFSMPPGHRSFRALKFPWASGLPSATVIIFEVLQGNTYIFNNSTDTTGTTIKFNHLEDFYNSVEVKRFEYAPINPTFEDRAPLVYPASITIETFLIDSLNIDVWFKVDQIPQIIIPANTIVYNRPTIGSGVFEPLSTSYLPGTNELKVSGVGYAGEFIFAYPDVPVVPTIPGLVSPLNNQLVNQDDSLKLEWSPTGFADKFYLQVSTDQNFTSPVVDDSNLTSLTYTLSTLLQEQDYFWHVKSKNLMGWGDWSDVWNFRSTAGYIDLTFPNGGETWDTDTSLVIYWDFNTTDSVNIDLYKNDVFSRTIVDSFFSVAGGYKWTLSDSISSGTDYKIKISSIDGSLEDMSESNFTIIYTPTDVRPTDELVTDFMLEQNYPNPFNPSTTIRYSIPTQSNVRLRVYNSIGENIADLINANQNAGSYEVSWVAENIASGIYLYSIESIPSDGTEIFRSVRKMILLK